MCCVCMIMCSLARVLLAHVVNAGVRNLCKYNPAKHPSKQAKSTRQVGAQLDRPVQPRNATITISTNRCEREKGHSPSYMRIFVPMRTRRGHGIVQICECVRGMRLFVARRNVGASIL